MHDKIALVGARLEDVLGRVDKGESGQWIKETRDAWRRFERAEKAGDEGEVEGARAEVDRLLRRLMCNCSDEKVGQVAQRSPKPVVEALSTGVGCDLGR